MPWQALKSRSKASRPNVNPTERVRQALKRRSDSPFWISQPFNFWRVVSQRALILRLRTADLGAVHCAFSSSGALVDAGIPIPLTNVLESTALTGSHRWVPLRLSGADGVSRRLVVTSIFSTALLRESVLHGVAHVHDVLELRLGRGLDDDRRSEAWPPATRRCQPARSRPFTGSSSLTSNSSSLTVSSRFQMVSVR